MNVVADEGVEASVVARLRQLGVRVWYVAEMAPASTDSEVFELANEHSAILLTADKDFGAMVFQQRRVTSGVVLIRLHGMASRRKAELVTDLFRKHSEQLPRAFTVLTADKVRIRPRPGND